jgi:putative DNA primase/helicase
MMTAIRLDTFRQEIERAGLVPPPVIHADGTLKRFSSNGERDDDAGWYILHADGLPAGVFGCFRSNLTQKWCAKSEQKLTERERAEYRTRIAAMQRQRDTEERQRHAAAAQRAQSIWDAARPAPEDHPYLQRKGVRTHGLRVGADGRLIVPIYKDGVLSSLEFIDQNGDKKFLFGGAKKGGSFIIGDPTNATTLLACEGYATGASLYEATSLPSVIAFDAGNLLPVAQDLRQQFPTATIVVCGDNDIRDDETPNVGLDAATAAANAMNGVLVMPDLDGQKCDFNDLAQAQGHDAVKDAIAAALKREETQTMATATAGTVEADVQADSWPQ